MFDIIGPNMIGPSSLIRRGRSHRPDCGAKLAPGRIVVAEFTLYGSFAPHLPRGTAPTTPCWPVFWDSARRMSAIRDSFSYADKAGLRYRFYHADGTKNDLHPNTVDILLRWREDGTQTRVRGVSVRGRSVGLSASTAWR